MAAQYGSSQAPGPRTGGRTPAKTMQETSLGASQEHGQNQRRLKYACAPYVLGIQGCA